MSVSVAAGGHGGLWGWADLGVGHSPMELECPCPIHVAAFACFFSCHCVLSLGLVVPVIFLSGHRALLSLSFCC